MGRAASHSDFQKILESAVKTIRSSVILVRAEAMASPGLDRAAIAGDLQELRAVLESYELIPNTLIKHLQGMLVGHVENSLVETLVQQISSYEYDNALATTEKMAAALDIETF